MSERDEQGALVEKLQRAAAFGNDCKIMPSEARLLVARLRAPVDPPERVSDWKTEPIGPAVQEFRRREEAAQFKAASEALERVSEASALTKWADNVLVSRVGAAVMSAANEPASDIIDRGLALIEYLRRDGFEIRRALEDAKGEANEEEVDHR